jgi:hypothetical protein
MSFDLMGCSQSFLKNYLDFASMRNISGHYTLPSGEERKFNADIPGSWDELTPKQFATISQLLTYKKADRYTILASLITVLFGPENYQITNNLPDEELHALSVLTNFIYETPPFQAGNKWPILTIRKKPCSAPAPDLSNLVFGEWCFLYEFYSGYVKHEDSLLLNKLIATVYRPIDTKQIPDAVNYSGDIREPFNENLIEQRARALQDVADYIKRAIFEWISGALTAVMEIRPHVFPEAISNDDAEASSGDSRTWLTVFRELLGPKWGTIEQLKHTNAMFVLDALEEQRIEFDKAAAPTE